MRSVSTSTRPDIWYSRCMMTPRDPICYRLTLVDEPHEDPIELTQADFDQLVRVGMAQPEQDPQTLVDFATLATVEPNDAFLYQEGPIDPEAAGVYCGRAIGYILREALQRAANPTSEN